MFWKFLLLVIFALLALLALLMSPEIGQHSCLRHAIENYFELNYYNYVMWYCDYLIFSEKKIVLWSGLFAIPCFFTLMFIPVVLALLTRNKRRMSIPKQYVLGW